MTRSAPEPLPRSLYWADHTWPEIRQMLDRQSEQRPLVAILPTGAVEAHGPHLPLQTDRVISMAMAERGAEHLARRGHDALVLPPVDYTAAPFARAFPGTVSVRPETVTALLVDVATALSRQGVRILALANAHFDPGHLGALNAARDRIEDGARGLQIVFPDVTRKPWALRLGDEFRSGACHAGRYEGSVVLALRPELVRDDVRRELQPVPVSLSDAIRDGRDSFEAAGGDQAYFGDPAAATGGEGETTIETLGDILAEAVAARLGE